MWKKNSKIKHTNLSKIPVRIQNVKIRFLVLKLEFGKFNLCRISGFIIADRLFLHPPREYTTIQASCQIIKHIQKVLPETERLLLER